MLTDIKNKIQAFFNEKEIDLEVVEKSEEKETEQKFEETTLVDGTVVNLEPSVEAPEIATVLADGEFLPMPANSEAELEDGRIIVTGEEVGVIIEVREAVEEAQEEAPVEEEEAMEEEKSAKRIIESIVKESVFATSEEVKELKETLVETFKYAEFVTKENAELKLKFEELQKETQEKLESFGKQESKEPVKESKNPFGSKSGFIFKK
ncbi:MAG: hypothetical protein HRU40_13605 [Saprospiraceae bacterium]|nr:hypothetical protein [Saprospiraceae bacterium]